MEKMKRKTMKYSKTKLVCSNCDEVSVDKERGFYSCKKMDEKNNWIQPYGNCYFHSGKVLKNILKSTRNGQGLKEEEVETREKIILNQLVRSIFEKG